MKRFTITLCLASILAACTTGIPDHATPSGTPVEIYPDYSDVTIPQNIAPLNFDITTPGDDYVAHIHPREQQGFTVSGPSVEMDIADWRQTLLQAAGDSVFIDIYVKGSEGWTQYPPVRMAVAREEIDPYITYRLIEPSYVNFEMMSINQRCLESFDETEIYNNQPFAQENKGQCINCHAAQDYNRGGRWQMHVRIENGGTLIADGDRVTKVDLKRPGTISAGVYPAWHPTLPLIVYSNNKTDQSFHCSDRNKVEVQDNASDLILYDIEADRVSTIANDTTEWETFPTWSPDGKYIYYVSATIPPMSVEEIDRWRNTNYKSIKYNIYRRPFDTQTKAFGAVDTVYMASRMGQSATLPRISPDGRYLLFTQGRFGTFHIWHHDADLWLIDLKEQRLRPLNEVNSDDTESYHSWSSNGRWMMFSSRRDDGSYTRLYISYFDENGRAHKPFLLPQHRAAHNTRLFKSYNVPEFIAKPVTTSRGDIIKTLSKPAR